MSRQRRPRLSAERGARVQRRYAPGSTLGAVSNMGRVPLLPRGRTGRSGGVGAYNLLPRTITELLKAEGVTPKSTYTLTHLPRKQWPHIVVGNVPALPGVDFTKDGNVITIQPSMRLIAADRLWTIYDYTMSPPPPQYDGPTVVGTPWFAQAVPGYPGDYVRCWWRMEGMEGFDVEAELGAAFWDPANAYESSTFGNLGTGPQLAGAPYANNIYYGQLRRPWYPEVMVQGLRVLAPYSTGTVVYDYPQPVTNQPSVPPADYQG